MSEFMEIGNICTPTKFEKEATLKKLTLSHNKPKKPSTWFSSTSSASPKPNFYFEINAVCDNNKNFSSMSKLFTKENKISNHFKKDVDLKKSSRKSNEDNNLIPKLKIKVKDISELQHGHKKNLFEYKGTINNNTEDIIELSSDDEKKIVQCKNGYQNPKDKDIESSNLPRKYSEDKTLDNKLSSFYIQRRNSNKLAKLPRTPAKKCRNRKAKEEERIVIKRQLTKSTNLKTFPAKFLSENQTKIDSFFKVTPNPNKIGYFETFSQSKPAEIKDDCVMDYVEVVMDDINRMKTLGIRNPINFINGQVNQFQKVSEKKTGSIGSQISSKKDQISPECTQNETSLCQYYSLRRMTRDSNSYLQANLGKDKVIENNEKVCNNIMSDANVTLDSDSSSIIIMDNSVSVDKAESVDYTPTKVQHEIEAHRAIMGSDFSCCTDNEVDSKSCKKSSRRKIITARKKINFTVNKKPRLSSDSGTLVKNNFRETESAITSVPTSHESRTILDKIDLTLYGTPDKSTSERLPSVAKININVNFRANTSFKSKSTKMRRKRAIKCPDYKIIEGTTFAVDAFRFGYIEGITHYFLTHFHSDHYIGLKKSFNKPVYLSEITARLVEAFIHTRRDYLHVMQINKPIRIEDIEVTALDANHCPGAVMFLFKFPNGMCTLHTGDFRACPEMEMEPAFWNNFIHTIYLDTTYLSRKYCFKTQWESIYEITQSVEEFRLAHIGEKVLYICGSYVIGKEKVWQAIAENNNFKVWTDGNRRKALESMEDQKALKFLVDDPIAADIHILTMGQLSYDYLYEYLKRYCDHFDCILAIRPSGWEKNSKPQYRGRINIIGVEYSEHSSYDELRRFVRFLQPNRIISTVPAGGDISKTHEIPSSWLNNFVKPWIKGYQRSITNYITSKCSSINKSISGYKNDLHGLENTNCSFNNGEVMTFSSKDMVKENSIYTLKANNLEKNNDIECFNNYSEPVSSDWMS